MARILMAEDSNTIASVVSARLEAAGHEVARVSDGEQVLEWLAGERPDLIILDVMMPTMDGLEVLRRLKEEPAWEAIPVLMLTAKAQEEDVVNAFSAGADDYMAKPFSPKELLARIARLTRG